MGAILAVLDVDDVTHLQRVRRIRDEAGDELDPEARETVAELIEALELVGVARTHFRTSYTQRVLARLSRVLLYLGVPAILAAFALALSVGNLPAGARPPIVAALSTLGVAPLAWLSAYILRIATISERTLAAGPFASRPE